MGDSRRLEDLSGTGLGSYQRRDQMGEVIPLSVLTVWWVTLAGSAAGPAPTKSSILSATPVPVTAGYPPALAAWPLALDAWPLALEANAGAARCAAGGVAAGANGKLGGGRGMLVPPAVVPT